MRNMMRLFVSLTFCLAPSGPIAAQTYQTVLSEIGGTWNGNTGKQSEFFARLAREDGGNISLRIWKGTTAAPEDGKRPAFENLDIAMPMLMQLDPPPDYLGKDAEKEFAASYREDLKVVDEGAGNVLRITIGFTKMWYIVDLQYAKNQYKVTGYSLRYPKEDGKALTTCDVDFLKKVITIDGNKEPLPRVRASDVNAKKWTSAAIFEQGYCDMN